MSELHFLDFKVTTGNGKILKFLIDTGSNVNYFQYQLVSKPKQNEKHFSVRLGTTKITQHAILKLPNISDTPMKFVYPLLVE